MTFKTRARIMRMLTGHGDKQRKSEHPGLKGSGQSQSQNVEQVEELSYSSTLDTLSNYMKPKPQPAAKAGKAKPGGMKT